MSAQLGTAGRGGRAEVVTLDSALLKGNPLGDPHFRAFPVYLPPGYDDGAAPTH